MSLILCLGCAFEMFQRARHEGSVEWMPGPLLLVWVRDLGFRVHICSVTLDSGRRDLERFRVFELGGFQRSDEVPAI